MQETLKLEQKSIKMPEYGINTAMLNSSNDFLITLRNFNEDYKSNIGVQNNGRWQQGTYDKFKELAINAFNPRLKKARNINSIFQTTNYHFNKLRDKLLDLDKQLKDIRISGIRFNDDNDNEGKNRFNKFITNIESSINNHPEIQVEISKTPWFNRKYYRDYDNNPPSQPVFNKNGQIIDYDNGDNSGVTGTKDVYLDTDNPMNLYLNIAIPIKDVNIKIFHQTANDKLLYEQEYGDLMVCFTVSLFDAIFIYRRAEKNITMGYRNLENLISGTTQTFPIYGTYKHPFVSQSNDRYHSYGTGNTCFGDMTERILTSVCSGELSRANLLLRMWAETYPKNNINPLNQYGSFIFGVPLNVKKGHSEDNFFANTELCKNQIDNFTEEISQQDFIETFCSNCKNISNCTVYKDWTYVPHELSDEESILLNKLSCSIYNANSTIQNWGSLSRVDKLVRNTYLFFNRTFHAMPDNGYSRGLNRILAKYCIRGKGNGKFISQDHWDSFLNKIVNDQEFTVPDFITLYHMGETIWYSHISDDHNIPIEGNVSFESTKEEIKSAISILRSVHLNLQRRSRVPSEELKTYASHVLYI